LRNVARFPENDRKELFRATAQQMQVHEAIIEKDFWVCWILDYLFQDSPWKDSLAFKGGTSLSKAYGAIERFSEDIDLILDWKQIGYADDEPWADRTSTQQDKFGKKANLATAQFLSGLVVPKLKDDLTGRLDSLIEVEVAGQDVLITYPRAFSLQAILPQVKLEIGPLAESIPNAQREIRPFAAEWFPLLFQQPLTAVRTVLAERTFWEKATILHQEAHRVIIDTLPPRLSRHYCDLFRLSTSPVKSAALSDMGLLERVAQFKMKFYRCPWAKYEEAKPGTLRLLPPSHHVAGLTRDYDSMQTMLFGYIPSFDEIMAGLAALETEINGSGDAHK
jgi:hypothetical protein